MTSTILLNSFNSGEISPSLMGRKDIPKVVRGASLMENFILTIQGSAYFRGGFKFASVLGEKCLTEDFTYNRTDTYTLVFGNLTLRIYRDGQQVKNTSGQPITLTTPYTTADLFDGDGLPALHKAQSSDVVYLFHKNHPVMRLERLAANNFTLEAVDYGDEGGFEDLNRDKDVRVYSSGQTGTVTLTASSNIFKSGHVGALFYLQPINFDGIYNWSEGRTVTQGQRIISDSKTYSAVDAGTTGYSKPTHAEGKGTDGSVEWNYEDDGYGIAKITSVAADGKSCTATVLKNIPNICVGDTRKTWKWKFGSWCAEYGYPEVGCFHRERLCLARGKRIWFSWSGDFESFMERDSGKITVECGFSFNISSGVTTGNIQWLTSHRDLLVGTDVNVVSVAESQTGEVFYVNNCRSYVQTDDLCRAILPLNIGNRVIAFTATGQEAFLMAYNNSSYMYDSGGLSEYAKHINVEGVIRMARTREPFDVIYCLKADGTLSCCLYDAEQEGLAWYRLKTDGFVESINVESDKLVASIVRKTKTANGTEVSERYLEYLQNPFIGFFNKTRADFSTDKEYEQYKIDALLPQQKEAIYLDSAVVFNSNTDMAEITSGLDHLKGRTVRIVADGGLEPDQDVVWDNARSCWMLTLKNKAKVVVVGLPYTGTIIPVPVELESDAGTIQFRKKRINKMAARLYLSMGGQYGYSIEKMKDLITRSGKDNLDNPIPLFTGDTDMSEFLGDYDADGEFILTQPYPFPMTLLAICYELGTY